MMGSGEREVGEKTFGNRLCLITADPDKTDSPRSRGSGYGGNGVLMGHGKVGEKLRVLGRGFEEKPEPSPWLHFFKAQDLQVGRPDDPFSRQI